MLLTPGICEKLHNDQIEIFANNIDVGVDTPVIRLRDHLFNLSGKLVLEEQSEIMKNQLRIESIKQALPSFTGDWDPRQVDGGRTILGEPKSYESPLRQLRPLISQIASDLENNSPIIERLANLLNRNGSAEAIYALSVRPAARQNPIETVFGELLTVNDLGLYVIKQEKRSAVQQFLQIVKTKLTALEDAANKTASLSEELSEDTRLLRRFKLALLEPTLTVILAEKLLATQSLPLEQIGDLIVQTIRQSLTISKTGLIFCQEADLTQLRNTLARHDRIMSAVYSIQIIANSLSSVIDNTDPINVEFQQYLVSASTLVALSGQALKVESDPIKTFFEKTILGKALIKSPNNGKWQVNRYSMADTERAINNLEKFFDDHALIVDDLNELAERTSDSELRLIYQSPAERFLITGAIIRSVNDKKLDGFKAWINKYFEPKDNMYQLKRNAKFEIRLMLELMVHRMQQVSEQLTNSDPPLTVNVDQLQFNNKYLHLFRSSTFFNPRSLIASNLYHTDFNSHDTVRIFGLFEWDGYLSTDTLSFKKHLWSRQALINQLSKTHNNFIVMINKMPAWLSQSSDQTAFEDTWKNLHTYRPKDYRIWNNLVKETVKFMSQFDSVNTYYEVWNEPDVGYWQDDINAYLEMYEQIVKTIKSVDHHAKVGGSSVNQWNGKLGDHDTAIPLNLELIRFAKKRNLPLDFISWHNFGHPSSVLKQAKRTYENELKSAGYQEMPEFVVSEWNIPSPLKETRYAAAAFADQMLGLYEAKVDLQTVAVWEDFHPKPDPKGWGSYGLVTQQGVKKPVYHVHKFFDQLSRDSYGVAVLQNKNKTLSVIISKKHDKNYELLLWESGYEPPFKAAISNLIANDVNPESLLSYGNRDKLEQAIRDCSPTDSSHFLAFQEASQIYKNYPQRLNRIHLVFPNVSDINVLEAKSSKLELIDKQIQTSGNALACNLSTYEVLWLHVNVSNHNTN